VHGVILIGTKLVHRLVASPHASAATARRTAQNRLLAGIGIDSAWLIVTHASKGCGA